MLVVLAALLTTAPCPVVVLSAGVDTVSLAGQFCWRADQSTDPHALDGSFAAARPGQAKLPRSKDALWIRHELENRDHAQSRWVLQLWTVPTDEAEVLVFDGAQRVSTARAQHPPRRSYHPFEIEVPRGERRVVYTRLESSRTPVAPVALSTVAALTETDFDKQLVMGLFFGLGLALLAYNGFLFAATRRWPHLAYVLHAATLWLLVLGENGLVDMYAHRWIDRWSPLGTPMLAVAVAAALVFTRSFLLAGPPSRTRRLLDLLTVLSTLIAVATWSRPALAEHLGPWLDGLLVVGIAAMMGAAVGRIRAGHDAGRSYLLAWGALFIPVLAWMAEAYGLIGQSLLTRYASELGTSLEMLLMSQALAADLLGAQRAAQVAERSHTRALEALVARQTAVNEVLSVAHRQAVDANELKTAFLTKVTHELRTPLNHVLGMVAALRGTRLDAEQAEYTNDVAVAGEGLAAMVERLLDLSALEHGDWTPVSTEVDVAQLLSEVIALRRGEATRRGLSLSMVGSSSVGLRLGDRSGLRRVLLELVDNAIRFTERGGVVVTLDGTPHTSVRIEVLDTGIGVPSTARDKLFALFSQVDDSMTRRHDGLGVGLALAQRIVARMGGNICLENRDGGGTRFWFELPLPLQRERRGLPISASLAPRGSTRVGARASMFES